VEWKEREETMNRWMLRLLLLGLGAALLVPVTHAQTDHNFVCSNATIKGRYAFRVTGEVFVSPAPPAAITIYRDGVAMTYFDGETNYEGKGHLWQEDYILGNGAFVAPDSSDQNTGTNQFNTNEQGTYQVFPDCTGEAEIDFPYLANTTGAPIPHTIKLKFAIAKHGEILHTIVSYLELLTPANTITVAHVNIHSDAESVN
jgi:hypothetical protein